jgi:hypothetical protein
MLISKFDLEVTPVIKESLDTDETAVTVTCYLRGTDTIVPLVSTSCGQVPAASGRWAWTVNPVTRPTSGKNQYGYKFVGTSYGQVIWGAFDWEEDTSRYNNIVMVDTSTGSAGTAYPLGTSDYPVDNIADAITIADRINTKIIHISGDITLTGSVAGYVFETENNTTSTLTLNGQDTTGCTFHYFTLTGDAGGYAFTARDCFLQDVTNCNFNGFDCVLTGTFSVAAGGEFKTQGSSVGSATGVIINCNGTGSVGHGKFVGIVTIMNLTSPASYVAITGEIIIIMHPTITAGSFYFGGTGVLTNYATSTTALTNLILPYASFNEALAQYTTPGTAGHTQRLSAYLNAVYINTSTGTAGTAFPLGTPFAPVSNLADAKTIAVANGIREFMLAGTLILDSDVSEYNFTGSRTFIVDSIDLNNQNITSAKFNNLSIIGAANGICYFEACNVTDVTNINCYAQKTQFSGAITIAAGGAIQGSDVFAGTTGIGAICTFDLQYDASASLIMTGFSGFATVKKLAGGLCVILGDGFWTFDSTIVAGLIIDVGSGYVSKNYTPSPSIIHYSYTVPSSVFNEPLTQYTTAGTAGHTIRLSAFGNKVYINTSTGAAGTAFPLGAPFAPVNNLADAITIADANGIKEFALAGLLTLDRSIAGYSIIGINANFTDTIVLANYSIAGCRFEGVTLTGAWNGLAYCSSCQILEATNFNGNMDNCLVMNSVSIKDGGVLQAISTAFLNYTTGVCAVDMQNSATSVFAAGDSNGVIVLSNMLGGLFSVNGTFIVQVTASVIAGQFFVSGLGNVDGVPGVPLTWIGEYTKAFFNPAPPYNMILLWVNLLVPGATHDTLLSEHDDTGTTGEALNKIYEIQTSTGHISDVVDELDLDLDLVQTINTKVDALITSTGHISETVDEILAGGTPLDPQAIRDAMKLAPSIGLPEADSIDDKLNDLITSTGHISETVDEIAGEIGAEVGARTITFTILTSSGSAIQDASVQIWNSNLNNIVTYGTTNSNGQVSRSINDGSYKVKVRKGNYGFNDPITLAITADASVTYYGETYIPDPPSSPSLCRIYGYVVDSTETAMEGASISFIPATVPLIQASTGRAIYAQAVQCTTDENGYFYQDLIRNTEFVAVIDAIGLKEKFLVPNSAISNLFELVTAYESGDSTPSDSGEDNW